MKRIKLNVTKASENYHNSEMATSYHFNYQNTTTIPLCLKKQMTEKKPKVEIV